MTAIDTIRAMLDERGVEWLEGSPNKTKWHVGGIEFVATNAWPCNDATRTKMVVHAMYPTPEQAVEATLGNEDTYTREDVESAFVSGYSLGSLPIGSDPRWDENKQTVDEHMAELGWVRKATLGRGECTDTGRYCFTCSECGWAVNEPHHVLGGFWPNYCPNCGRKVVDA